MIMLKRLATAAVFFLPMFLFFYFGICMAGGMVAGMRIALDHPGATNLAAQGGQAGREFVRNNLGMILLGAFVLSSAGSLALAFSGLFPWCRKPQVSQVPQVPQFPQVQ
jgi:hypothetical protein